MESPTLDETDEHAWEPDTEATSGDFARLIPLSPLARSAFNEVAQKIHDEPDALPHARRYVHFQPYVRAISSERDPIEQQRYKWCGFYRLNTSIPPRNLNLGWVIGSSRTQLPQDGVDLLLTTQSGAYGVHGRHARLRHNVNTRVLMVYADNWTVWVNMTIRLRSAATAVCERTGLLFGDLAYIIEFGDLDDQVYQTQTRDMYGADQATSGALAFLSPTPTSSSGTYHMNHYLVFPVNTGGVSSAVSHAFHKRTGNSVAMKKMKRQVRNFDLIRTEVIMLRSLDHENVCRLLEAIGYERTTPFGLGECDEVVLVFPFSPPLLRHVGLHDFDWILCVSKQVFAGLAYLQRSGVMHRDIKLDNIGIVDTVPPKAVILDFGNAKRHPSSTNHMVGTMRYLAPEIMALKNQTSSTGYDGKVDVWAFGICVFELFFKSLIWWHHVDEESYSVARDRISIGAAKSELDGSDNPDSVSHLMVLMDRCIVWDSELRGSAAELSEYFDELGGTELAIDLGPDTVRAVDNPYRGPHWPLTLRRLDDSRARKIVQDVMFRG